MTIEPIMTRRIHYGTQKIYGFDNGFGASVIRTLFSIGHEEGLWEIAITKYCDDVGKWAIVYNVPTIECNNTIGNLTLDEVEEYLVKIKDLPKTLVFSLENRDVYD